MKPVIDTTKEYGLVLEGGGAKGAWQIGAWKALKEAGVKIRGVAGTSVGALNGALICMGDLERAENLWKNIEYSQVMDVNDERMQSLFDKARMTPEFLRETLKDIFRTLGQGGMDITPLRHLIEENIDEEAIRKSPVDFYSCTFSLTDWKEMDVDMKSVPDGQMKDMLLASSYLPVFKNEKLHGKTYVDGGTTNVLPMNVLLEQGYRDLILLRIYGVGIEKRVEIPEDVTILEIGPKVSLGSVLQFDSKKSRRNLRMGYFDTMKAIYGLEGEIYYIEQTGEECYYLNKLVQVKPELQRELLDRARVECPEGQELRAYVERLLPLLAEKLKLPREWSYRELYLKMLEQTARALKVPRYWICTPESLLAETEKRAEEKGMPDSMPEYGRLILNR